MPMAFSGRLRRGMSMAGGKMELFGNMRLIDGVTEDVREGLAGSAGENSRNEI
jgi:hypothetical protein